MKRRTFIQMTVGAVAATGFVYVFMSYKESKWKSLPLMYPQVLSGFCDEETIRSMGNSYRIIVPAENSKVNLLELLTNGFEKKHLSSSDNTEVAILLDLKVEQDFKADKMLILNGWVISETEARQCALLSFS